MKDLFEIINLESEELKTVKEKYELGAIEEALKVLYQLVIQRPRSALFSGKEQAKIYLKNHPQLEIQLTAQALYQDTFVFNDEWDMEKCLTPVSFPKGQIDWHHVHDGDVEWMFMLNRQHYLIKLIQQYWMTGEACYYQKCEEILLSWMDTESEAEDREETSWRTIDTGLRLKNWVRLFEYLVACPLFSETLFVQMLLFIQKHLVYLSESYVAEQALSNWRILEFHGVFLATTYFDFLKISPDLQQKSLAILEESLVLQVTNDGFHWEQSNMYHHEVLICMLEVILCAQKNQVTIPTKLLEKVRAMAEATSHLVTPAGEQTCYGDSDIENVQDILTLAAVLFPEVNFGNYVLASPSVALLLLYGPELFEICQNSQQEPLAQTDFVHEDVGNYFLRTGWQTDDSFIFFKNGFLGSGHGHSDLLHFDLIVRGVPVLVDSGRYSYNPQDDRRQQYKSLFSHNSICLNNQDIVEQKRAWGTMQVPNEIKRSSFINEEVVLVQGMHLGYRRGGCIVNRKIIWIKPGIWLVVDQVFASKETKYSASQRLHFQYPLVEHVSTGFSYPVGTTKVMFHQLDEQELAIEDCHISPQYNTEYISQVAILNSSGQGDQVKRFLIVDPQHSTYSFEKIEVKDMNNQQVADQYVEALRVTMDTTTWDIVVNYHEEPTGRKLYVVGNSTVYGRTAVIKKAPRKKEQIFILEY
ncbi:alginate lyase family protein [Enterococcus faecalis]|uniref:alginate lyase family protein n=1 Tax=Enterococcus faecalis TaxID=1351 RepID=UPI0032DFA489